MSVEPGADDRVGPVASVREDVESTYVSITVNGARIQVTEHVTVREIVEKASDAGAISGFVEEYVIERIEEDGDLGLTETIVVRESEEFIAVPIGKTDVA